MNKTPLAIVLMATLSACGGGGSSSDNGGAKASLTFTPVQDVAALVGTQSVSLTATRASTSWSPISAAYADDVSTTVELVATDVGGNQFKTNFLDEEGNPASETVTPTGLVRLDDDHAMVELFVMTNKATNLHEYRHYLVEYSTGKMILVETLASLANAWTTNAVSYAAGANSLHNATNDIIYRKEDTKWYKLTPNWDDLTLTETYYTDSTSEDKTDLGRTLPMPNGDLFTVSNHKAYLNGTELDVGSGFVVSVFQKDAQAFAITSNQLFNITGGAVVKQAELPSGSYNMLASAISFDGNTINLANCSSYSVSGDVISVSYAPSDRDTAHYDAVMAGSDMICTGTPNVASAKKAVKAATRAADFTSNDETCDRIDSWDQSGGNRLLHVANGVEQRISGVDGVYAVIPMSRDTAYVNQYICTATGGDGVSSAKWELDLAHTPRWTSLPAKSALCLHRSSCPS